jgi:hypothetical protein
MTANTFGSLQPMLKDTYSSKDQVKAPTSFKNTEKYGRLKKILRSKPK